jgi:hypothetical protein
MPMRNVSFVLLLIAVTGCGPIPGQCRSEGEACTVSDDCCNPLLCSQGVCRAAEPHVSCGDGVCDPGESAANCCRDCGCGNGESCNANVCEAPHPRCGDGTCDPGENAATCCSDCGCPGGESCRANACVPDATCGDGVCNGSESSANCCADCGCAPGFACGGNVCQPIAQCGNGVCEAGENQGNCCADCGCATGESCRANACVNVGTSTLQWTVTDSCGNGEAIYYRFWDIDDHLVWPNLQQAYIASPGGSYASSLLCTTGDRICLGGREYQHNLEWGVDVDDSKSCANCCFVCANASVALGPLTCQ